MTPAGYFRLENTRSLRYPPPSSSNLLFPTAWSILFRALRTILPRPYHYSGWHFNASKLTANLYALTLYTKHETLLSDSFKCPTLSIRSLSSALLSLDPSRLLDRNPRNDKVSSLKFIVKCWYKIRKQPRTRLRREYEPMFCIRLSVREEVAFSCLIDLLYITGSATPIPVHFLVGSGTYLRHSESP